MRHSTAKASHKRDGLTCKTLNGKLFTWARVLMSISRGGSKKLFAPGTRLLTALYAFNETIEKTRNFQNKTSKTPRIEFLTDYCFSTV